MATADAERARAERAALDVLAERRGYFESLLAELVAINSFTGNPEGCDRVARRLKVELEALGLAVELCPSESPSPHGTALWDRPPSPLSTEGAAPPPTDATPETTYGLHLLAQTVAALRPGTTPLLLVGHHDTVFAPGTFDGYRSDATYGYGPGVLDMKGGLVVILAALDGLHRTGALGGCALRFLSVSDEEVGSPSSRGVLARAARGASAALVFESGRAHDAIVTQRKGAASLRVAFGGRAAHAGNDFEQGASAVWALARFVDAAQSLTDLALGSTVNVGRVEGGEVKNTVPARAEALVDVRFTHGAAAGALLDRLERAARAAASSVAGVSVHLVCDSQRPPLERTAASAALVARYGACQRQAGLGDGEAPLQGGGSDANLLGAMGLATIDGLGPRGRGLHTRDEQIERATLLQKSDALVRFLLRHGQSGYSP
jgi:glutamate carboxypeptidase